MFIVDISQLRFVDELGSWCRKEKRLCHCHKGFKCTCRLQMYPANYVSKLVNKDLSCGPGAGCISISGCSSTSSPLRSGSSTISSTQWRRILFEAVGRTLEELGRSISEIEIHIVGDNIKGCDPVRTVLTESP